MITSTLLQDFRIFTGRFPSGWLLVVSAFRLETMLSTRSAIALALMLFVLAKWSAAMPTTDKDKERLLNTVDVSIKTERTCGKSADKYSSYFMHNVRSAWCYLFEFIRELENPWFLWGYIWISHSCEDYKMADDRWIKWYAHNVFSSATVSCWNIRGASNRVKPKNQRIIKIIEIP